MKRPATDEVKIFMEHTYEKDFHLKFVKDFQNSIKRKQAIKNGQNTWKYFT